MVQLNETQVVYVRRLLFEELERGCEILAEQAAAAVQGNVNGETVDGEDAFGTCRHCVQVTVDLLDTVGWSTRHDTATIVKLEQARRLAS